MPLPQPLPDLAGLDLLVSVDQKGSISAAAAAHHVTQPAASMRLRTLERALGLQLLSRARTGSRLTPAGTATVEWAGAVLQAVRTLLAGTDALRSDERSHLRLAASLTVAEYLVPGWLRHLSAVAPEVVVSLEMGNSSNVVEMVEHGRVDLGFVEGPRPPVHLQSRDICADRLLIIVGARHPWARRHRPVTVSELAATPLVTREQGSGTRDILSEALAQRGLEFRALMELGSTTAIKAAAISGAGPAVLSALALKTELGTGELVVVECPELQLERTIRAVWHGKRSLPEPANQLMAIASPAKAGKSATS